MRLQAVREQLRENLWFLSLICVTVSMTLAVVLSRTHPLEGSVLARWLFTGSAETAQSVLASLLAAMVTAASVVGSLTIVALQTASTQFSPRLLRNFLRDRTTHVVLATFVATSGFLVVLLLEIGPADRVPGLAMNVALFGVLTSVVLIAYFFHHVSQSIRVESIVRSVTEETVAAIDRRTAWVRAMRMETGTLPPIPGTSSPIVAGRSGYVQQVDAHALWNAACERDIVILIVAQPGQPVLAGTPVGWWWTLDDAPNPPPQPDAHDPLCDTVDIGFERTLHHDVGLGVRQLVDMAIKAMSPAVNDPYTAMQAIDHIGQVLGHLVTCPLGDQARYDDSDRVRVAIAGPTFAELAGLGCEQIRRYGAREPAVASRQLSMLRDVASLTDDAQRSVLRALAEQLAVDAVRETPNEHDRQRIQANIDEALRRADDPGV